MKIITVILFLTSTLALTAAQNPEDRDWSEFIGLGATNYDMQDRAKSAISELGDRIDVMVAELSAGLDQKATELLIKNQTDWLAYAKSKSSFLSDSYRDGTHSGLAYGYAFVEEQIARISELKQMAKYRNEP